MTKTNLTANYVLKLLSKEYGPIEWHPRHDPASELVYTILSQHTSDINSGRAFDNLMQSFGSIEAIANSDIETLEKTILTAGLFRIKARRIKIVLNQILEEVGSFDLSFLSEMPLEDAKTWLKKFDGIGPKTAAVILCFSLGMPAMPVDTHIHRVTTRLGLIDDKLSAEKAHDILESMISEKFVFPFHMYLIKHGRQVCKARNPLCNKCILNKTCPSSNLFQKT